MGKILDISVVLILLAFVGTGACKGLVMTLERSVSFVGGLIGAHIGASSLKGIVSSKFILPWLSEQTNDSGYNPSVEILNGVGEFGKEMEQELIRMMENAGIPGFSLSGLWGRMIDGLTGTGTNILDTEKHVVAERISYVIIFIILLIVIQLASLILFSSIDGLKHLPLLGWVNRVGGGAAGFLTGIGAVLLLMLLISVVYPKSAGPGAFMSPEVLADTHVAGKLYGIMNDILP